MPTRPELLDQLVRILTDMTQDWETSGEPIGPQTKLIEDLGFESIDVVHLVVAIEEAVQRRDLRFEELLMNEGSYVEELTVEQIVDFLSKNLAA